MNRSTGLAIFFSLLVAAGCGDGGVAMESAAKSAPPSSAKAPVKTVSNPQHPVTKTPPRARSVSRTASLTVRVADVELGERAASDYISSIGGYVASVESSDLSGVAPLMTLRLRVPEGKFDQALRKFESLGQRLEKQITAEDVTAQLVDQGARLRIMRAQEESFLRATRSATPDYDLQNRLMALRQEIESLESQNKALSELASLSNITLKLISEMKSLASTSDPGWSQETWNSATTAFGFAARAVGALAMFLVAFSPFWLPVGYLAYKKTKPKRA